MAKEKVLVTRKIPQAGIELLRAQDYDLVIGGDEPMPRAELLRAFAGQDAILCLLHDAIDEEAIEAANGVRVFSNLAVGFNNIDTEACKAHGIRVTNTPDVLTDATADLAWTLLLATARRVVECDKFMREGNYHGWGPLMLLGADVTGQTIGIIGAGRIGRVVAERAKGFRMRILYHDEIAQPHVGEWEKEMGAQHVSLDTLLAESDFVTVHCPLIPETTHLIGAPELKKMKKSAILINDARGPIIDEAALVEALKNGEIAGAGLDVFENEPEMAPGLAELENTVLLPHLGSATHNTRDDMATLAANNLIAVLNGEEPPAPVV